MAFVYLLRCADGSLYCGWTTDLEQRVATHNAGKGARYTKSRRPVSIAAAWEAPTNNQARSAEARIKRLPRSEKLKLLRPGAVLPTEALVQVPLL